VFGGPRVAPSGPIIPSLLRRKVGEREQTLSNTRTVSLGRTGT
jgi:hypothetical protein